MIQLLVKKMANLITENKNITKDPMYNPIFLKAGLAHIYKILDRITCQIDAKLILCFDENADIQPTILPLKYSVKANVSYDLNQLADQEGNIEENCTNAFINKITIIENFSYLDCQETEIPFDTLFLTILDEVNVANYTESTDIVNKVVEILKLVYNDSNKIVNEIVKGNIDPGSGLTQYQKQIKHDLYQSTVISLNDETAYVLESLTLEVDKVDAFGQVSLGIKSISLEMFVELENENPENIDVSTTC